MDPSSARSMLASSFVFCFFPTFASSLLFPLCWRVGSFQPARFPRSSLDLCGVVEGTHEICELERRMLLRDARLSLSYLKTSSNSFLPMISVSLFLRHLVVDRQDALLLAVRLHFKIVLAYNVFFLVLTGSKLRMGGLLIKFSFSFFIEFRSFPCYIISRSKAQLTSVSPSKFRLLQQLKRDELEPSFGSLVFSLSKS